MPSRAPQPEAKPRKRATRKKTHGARRAPITTVAVEPIVQRWSNAAARLGLSEVAERVGALLLRAELDHTARQSVTQEDSGSLRRAALLAAAPDAAAAAAGLIELERRSVVVPHTSGDWLSGEVGFDPRVRATCIAGPPFRPHGGLRLEHTAFPTRVTEQLREWTERARSTPQRWLVVLRGRHGSGRDTIAQLIADSLDAPLLRRAPEELRGPSDMLEPELSGSLALWDAAGLDPSPEDLRRAAAWLARSPSIAIALVDPSQDAPDAGGRDVVMFGPQPLSVTEREHVWRQALTQSDVAASTADDTARRLARRNRAGAGLASRAVRALQVPDDTNLLSRIEHELATLARPSTLRGIVVEHPQIARFRLVLGTQVRAAVERVLALARSAPEDHARRGVKAIFSGGSGTGKSLAARIIASELDLPLFRIDLAAVVSKWVGETEKNLTQALQAAESAGALLLFDEGDALFAKRGEVQRGTDRYANMEASHLLQAFEAHDGIALVTTNLKGNIDSAFLRRFDLCVHFQAPSATERAALWRQELGPVADSLESAFLLRTLSNATLSGGNIASAARLARALAAERGDALVTEADLHTAVGSEFDKMGATGEAKRWFDAAANGAAPTDNGASRARSG